MMSSKYLSIQTLRGIMILFLILSTFFVVSFGSIGDPGNAKIKIVPNVWDTWWEYLIPGVKSDVLCYIGNLPAGYSVGEIEVNSILLNGTVPITAGSDTLLAGYPGFADSVLRVGFNKREAILSLGLKGKDSSLGYQVTVTGLIPSKNWQFNGVARIKLRKHEQNGPLQGSAKFDAGILSTFELSQNYPNPFNPETEISFNLPDDGYVNLTILNILGQRVRMLVDEFQHAGHITIHWDGKDDQGQKVTSGVYFYRLDASNFTQTRKMTLIK